MEQGISDKILNHCVDSSVNIKIDYDIAKRFKFSSFQSSYFTQLYNCFMAKVKF